MKVKVKVKLLSRVRLLATPWTTAYQAPLSMGFARREYCRMAIIFKKREREKGEKGKKPCIGNNMEKLEPTYSADGNVKCATAIQNSLAVP